jgi:hypothetical protein
MAAPGNGRDRDSYAAWLSKVSSIASEVASVVGRKSTRMREVLVLRHVEVKTG